MEATTQHQLQKKKKKKTITTTQHSFLESLFLKTKTFSGKKTEESSE